MSKENPRGDRPYSGLKKLVTGAPQHRTPPTPNSKTQKRKRNRTKGRA